MRVGADKSTVWHWAQGHNLPGGDLIPTVAKELGVSIGELLGETGSDRTPSVAEKSKTLRSLLGARMADEQISIPLLAKVAAGRAVFEVPDDDPVSVGRKGLERVVGTIPPAPAKIESVVFAARVKGAMTPGIRAGDTLIAQRYYPPPANRPRIDSGKVYILAPNASGEAQVKRLLLVEGNQIIVSSDNAEAYPPHTVDARNVDRIQHLVIGRVIRLIRDF